MSSNLPGAVMWGRAAVLLLMATVPTAAVTLGENHAPLALHPENGHYFLFRGKAAVLIGSGEHYGAVLNADFDYLKYLDELARCRLQHTRLFSGAYVEHPGAFGIARNTLAPAPGRYLAPWARSDQPGYQGGGNKFDLTRWDSAYFARLHAFMKAASERAVVVEVNLFCPFYEEDQWRRSPQNAINNVNNIGTVPRTDVYTLDKNGGLLAIHEALTKKIVTELNGYDNLYYEICNEPYFGGVTMQWQEFIADTIVKTENSLPQKHLISMNIANGSKKVENIHPAISILNFHYAFPPDAVAENYHWDKVIGENETGFKGTADDYYRREAWEFILAGGALFSHLDYSFAVGFEDGSFAYPETQPGGGSRALREQLRFLRSFMEQFDVVALRPAQDVVRAMQPASLRVRLLAEPGRQYAAYLAGANRGQITLDVPRGSYQLRWFDPRTGHQLTAAAVDHAGGPWRLELRTEAAEAALSIRRHD